MKLKSLTFALSLLASAAPFGAGALTCGEYSAKDNLEAVLASGAKAGVFMGYLRDKEVEGEFRTVPDKSGLSRKEPLVDHPITHLLTGAQLNPDGVPEFTRQNVSITEACVLEWCGSAYATHTPKLIILRDVDGVWVGQVGPCGGSLFPMPTSEQSAAIQKCRRDGNCGDGTEELNALVAPKF